MQEIQSYTVIAKSNMSYWVKAVRVVIVVSVIVVSVDRTRDMVMCQCVGHCHGDCHCHGHCYGHWGIGKGGLLLNLPFVGSALLGLCSE